VPSLAALETEFDRRLPADRLRGPAPAALIAAGRAWSAAVLEAAATAGAATLDGDTIRNGLAIARQPVFICGAHRSGTTLVRDLLDGHPSLSVLPAEGTHLTNFAPTLASKPARDWLSIVAGEWVRRLANPINRPPYWLLGRSGDAGSPYVMFVRTLASWWREIESRFRATHQSWPLIAVALAWADAGGGLRAGTLSRWAEKTPTNERFLDVLTREYPAAVTIHVVRHPFAVLASRKQLEIDATGRFAQFARALDDLTVSFRVASERAADEPGYCRIRYEDVVAEPARETERLARALSIAWEPVLLTPTVAGQPASSNTANGARSERGRIAAPVDRLDVLTPNECTQAAETLSTLAFALGYDLTPAPSGGPSRSRAGADKAQS
jgi:hypothetical protein